MNHDFKTTVETLDPDILALESLDTLQLNLGNLCNQSCAHCHVSASPKGTNIMSKSTMDKILAFIKSHPNLTIDITGGCPEMNPNFRFLAKNAVPSAKNVIIRTNLTILTEPDFQWLTDFYAQNQLTIIASLPCYTPQNVDSQRGLGTFEKSIEAMKILNKLDYGTTDGKEFNLVYNPAAGFLPGDQQQLQTDYKSQLLDRYGVTFTNLFTITNAPIGRFRQYLSANGQLKSYMKLLVDNFNPQSVTSIMCRNQISIDFQGFLYNCDFNQALKMPIIDAGSVPLTIDNLEELLLGNVPVKTADHCFCCTAGAGSSCTGSLV